VAGWCCEEEETARASLPFWLLLCRGGGEHGKVEAERRRFFGGGSARAPLGFGRARRTRWAGWLPRPERAHSTSEAGASRGGSGGTRPRRARARARVCVFSLAFWFQFSLFPGFPAGAEPALRAARVRSRPAADCSKRNELQHRLLRCENCCSSSSSVFFIPLISSCVSLSSE